MKPDAVDLIARELERAERGAFLAVGVGRTECVSLFVKGDRGRWYRHREGAPNTSWAPLGLARAINQYKEPWVLS